MLIETKSKTGNVENSQSGFIRQCQRLGVKQYRVKTLEQAQRIARAFDDINKIVSDNRTVKALLQSVADLEGTPKKKRVDQIPAGMSAGEFLFGEKHG